MNKKRAHGRILPCPGLKITTNAGVSFTDSLGRVHDLEREKVLRPKQAAATLQYHEKTVLRLIRAGDLYPVFRRNARVILIFDCALTDWRARQITTQPLRHTEYRKPETGDRKPAAAA